MYIWHNPDSAKIRLSCHANLRNWPRVLQSTLAETTRTGLTEATSGKH
uniref:Uncharacterized protein n=1 Tax=Anguilla anguilla TaxID=7936 RepID=A0A0E9PEQ0_ANGAN